MTLYSVYERRLDEAPAVVPDRFSWFAALLPPVYAIAHGLWLGLLGWIVGVVAIGVASIWLGGEATLYLYLLFAILCGWEATGFRRRALRRHRYIYRTELIAAEADLAQVDWMKRRSGAA